MARDASSPLNAEGLLRDFRQYDRTVDVVCAYHWFFTETRELPATVAHFERYPKLTHPDGKVATPDFTVLFNDGSGIVAEIANLALHENSVEKLCDQLLRYDGLEELPGPDSRPVPAAPIDVIYLAPLDDAEAAANRVYRQRLYDDQHPFKPSKPPVLIQFGYTSDKYVFQIWPDRSINGQLTRSERQPDYAQFEESLKIRPDMFAANKVRHAFVNDPVPPLHLATRLWNNVLPSRFEPSVIEITSNEIASILREQYDHGSTQDVRAAMQVLAAAGLAVDRGGGSWSIDRRKRLRRQGDAAVEIAELISSRRRAISGFGVRSRRKQSTGEQPPNQGRLFD